MSLLIQRAKGHLIRTAIVSEGKSYTYATLLAAAESLACLLLAEKKDLNEARIAFMVAPGFDYVKVQWGIWLAGGIAVPLCVTYPLQSLQYVLEDTQTAIVVVGPEFRDLLQGYAEEKKLRFLVLDTLESVGESPLPEVASSRRAMILYTSGTTNLPKGVVTTHANIEAQISTLVSAWEWQSTDRILNILPLHHVHGIINVVGCALWSGACCVFLPKFSEAAVFSHFRSGELTLFMAVPTIYFKLIAYWDALSADEKEAVTLGLQKFRLMVSGSAALPVSVMEKWEAITGIRLLERYGMTEIGMGLSNPYHGERRAGFVGLPLPGVEMRLVDETESIVPLGEPGEIQIKGATVFQEYWQRPAASEEAFTPDGWFKTGDIAVFENNSYKILGRSSVDIIKSGGYKLSALEIEEVLREHPAIADCSVVGVPDEEWGELVCTVLVLQQELQTEALSVWLRERLPGYKIPRKYQIVAELPRNAMGKVTKKELIPFFK
jgi:malonyl-CoA/methylmalonyl-CoA synthetase